MIPNRNLIDSLADRVPLWIVVFHLNLLIPGMLGLMVADGPARWGMLLGIIICFTLGLAICCYSKPLGTLLIWGAWPVAALQFLPMMHIFIGSAAVAGGSRFNVSGQRNVDHLDSFLGGLLATGFTGGALMGVSLLFGLIIQLGIHLLWHRTTRT